MTIRWKVALVEDDRRLARAVASEANRDGRELGLTGIEFRILADLMPNSGQLVTYAQPAEAVWAVTTGPASNSLEVHISRSRQKLEQDGASRLIQTVRGLRYRFSSD